jgi:thiosulfate/3-mercaptopyruvate sulfurtransferase
MLLAVAGIGLSWIDPAVVVFTRRVAFIDIPTLARALASENPPTVIDIRWRLGGPPGRMNYREGHIPGAAYLDLDAQLCGPPGPGGRHPLPDPVRLGAMLRAAGVRTGHRVVVYDHGDGQAAARLWWTLRWAGHDDVRVLDGGFAAWASANRPVEPGTARPRPGDFVVRPGAMPVLDAAGAARLAEEGLLLDARVAPRFLGEHEPIDSVAGHIPGAVNLPTAALTGPDGLLPADDLRRVFAEAGVRAGEPVGAYCGSGITAAYTVFALHLAGFSQAALYVGSWSEWVADPDRPVGTGAGR